jgi:hypothetical protein
MQTCLGRQAAIGVVLLLTAGASPARASGPAERSADETQPDGGAARKAAARGLAFLQADAAKWREDRKCATCHHGTMTIWALSEARSRGYSIDDDLYRDVVNWTKERLANIGKPRDTRPGWKMVNTPAVYLALFALAAPGQGALSADESQQISGHLLRHQEADGSWAWSSAPAHKLACLIYKMLKYGEEFTTQSMKDYEATIKANAVRALQRRAAAMGYQLSPSPNA